MPSHTDTDPKKLEIAPSWMKEWHANGNTQADIRADAAADLWRVPAIKAKGILSYILNPEVIRDRLISDLELTLDRIGAKKNL